MQPIAQPEILDNPNIVTTAFNKTKRAFGEGKTKPMAFRVQQLANLKKGLLAMQKELCEEVQKDLGRESFATWFYEFSVIEKEIDHTLANLKAWRKGQCVSTPVFLGPACSRIIYEPLGVACIIGSWNFPLYTTLAPLIYAIAAGNAAVIKPSEVSAFTSKKLKALITRWLDLNCFACVEGKVEVAKALTNSKFDLICFTGSTEKGKLVAEAAGKNLVPCILELGGKSPAVVDENANLEHTAKKIALGRFLNAGQVCISPDYVLVHYQVTEKFITYLGKAIKELWAEGANVRDMGKVINEFHHDRLCSLLKDHRGNVVIGNASAHDDGNLTPTVILNPSKESTVMKEEIFGPILPVLSYQKFDEVIQTIKENHKPLTIYYFGSVFSGNRTRLENETSSGSLVTNETLFQMVNPNLPFGGVGQSGYGRYHGIEGFKAFSN